MLGGYLLDADDERDRRYSFGALFGSVDIVDSISLGDFVEPRNQGQTYSCTGYAGAVVLRIALFEQTGDDPGPLSAYDAYFKGRSVWGGQDKDEGSYLRTLLRALSELGCAAESAWPSNDARLVNRHPSWKAQKSARAHRLPGAYHPILASASNIVDEVRRALSRRKPVIGGWMIGDNFIRADGVIEPDSQPRAGHAAVLDGFNADGTFNLINSGGTRWGNGGRARVSEAFVRKAARLWAI